mmetsp:Transcript_57621/g.100826  ORF Transcript_57621/g.100826 Transcript_57621/m.100826 type:complete len:438 (-) Transcript_57621:48-1361(-)
MVLTPWLIREDVSTSGESDVTDDVDSWTVQNHAELLGLDIDLDEEIIMLAREPHLAPLPEGWSQHMDDSGRLFFYNQLSNASVWSHPGRQKCDELTQLIKGVKAELPPASEARCKAVIQEHLLAVQQRACQEINTWTGPYTHEGELYYYNSGSDQSTWLNPVEMWQDELNSRARILAQALLPRQSQADYMFVRGSASKLNTVRAEAAAHFRRSRPPPIDISSPCVSRAASPSSACFHSTRSRWSSRSTRSATPPQSRTPPPQRKCFLSSSPKKTPVQPTNHVVSSSVIPECTAAPRQLLGEVAGSAAGAADVEQLIELFVKESSQSSLKLPPTLSAQERKKAKALAERHEGLKCESFGFGAERQLHIFKENVSTEQSKVALNARAGSRDDPNVLQDFTFGRNEELNPASVKGCDASSLHDFTFGHAHPYLNVAQACC